MRHQILNIGLVGQKISDDRTLVGELKSRHRVTLMKHEHALVDYSILDALDVISLTEREHTMQSAAYEAISLGTPVVTSDWPILRRVFKRGAVFVDNTPEGIAAGVRHIMQHRDYYQNEVSALRRERQKVWQTVKQNLHHLITNDLLNG